MSPADIEAAVAVAVALCVKFEGFYGSPYLCPAGVPSIGFGSTRYLDGRSVQLTDPPITREAALELCRETIHRRYARAVLQLCPGVGSSNRLAALADFTYNLGESRLRASTLRKRVNAGLWNQVPAELRKWNKGAGRVLRGLTLRRSAEVALI